jgi:hypothetical protein
MSQISPRLAHVIRSSTETFMEGMTPSKDSSEVLDLLVALRTLGKFVVDSNSKLANFLGEQTSISLTSTEKLKVVCDELMTLLKNDVLQPPIRAQFREVVLCLIVVAELQSEVGLSTAVIELVDLFEPKDVSLSS